MITVTNTIYGLEELSGKVCITCNEFKTIDNYYSKQRSEMHNNCKKCCRDKRKVIAKLKKENKMSENYRCIICDRAKEDFMHRYAENPFCLDHDHKTNEFRGFICMDCNTGLSRFQDNPELLEKAAEYLLTGGFKKFLMNGGSQNVYEQLLESL
jgi:hypothetical protein